MNFMTKTLVFVFCTWLLTILFCAFMYFGAFNFHESYGLFGEWSGDANCHRGPHGEWYALTREALPEIKLTPHQGADRYGSASYDLVLGPIHALVR